MLDSKEKAWRAPTKKEMPRIVVLTALESELDAASAVGNVKVVYGGVGKINAAIATATEILAEKPSLLVNYGTCGKITKELRGLVEVSHVLQRDMMAMPLAPRGTTPFDHAESILASGHGSAVCGTGDSFVTSVDSWLISNNVDVVDMELFAIAHVCRRFGVAWRAFKYVTDGADESAPEQWTSNCAKGSDLFWSRLKTILDEYS
ncbi:phosphorylase family protein [Bradyrhizobium sp. USDA 4504]